MRHSLNILWLVVGTAIGLRFADIDQHLPFLTHRSILTHGFLVPLLLLYWVRKPRPLMDEGARLFVIGLCLASAVHLGFDLFPRGWYQHALIHIPLYGWTSPIFSILWMLASILVCLWIALRLVEEMTELVLGAGAMLVAFWFAATSEPHIALYAAVVMIVATLVVLALPPRVASSS